MTQAVKTSRDGHTFQARVFWRKAAYLLDPSSPVTRIGFESGPSGFDDVWVQYEPGRAPKDQFGVPLQREHIQCKWHVAHDDFGYGALVDPNWINAKSRSHLRRAYDVQARYAPNGTGARFCLLTNAHFDREDPLRKLIHQGSGTLRLDNLFKGKTLRSGSGAIRQCWRDHLNIDDDALRSLARTLRFAVHTEPLDELRESLDGHFSRCGLKRVPPSESTFVYDHVVYEWLGQGRLEFSRDELWGACRQEGLIEQGGRVQVAFGVKSFEHAFDRLEDRCTEVLDLVPHFDDRALRPESSWAGNIHPGLRDFLRRAARSADTLRLVLDAHTSLAFAAGDVVNIKSGRAIEIEQRTVGGLTVWKVDAHGDTAPSGTWSFSVETLDEDKPDLAIAVGVTHDVKPAVLTYLSRSESSIGHLLVACPPGGPGAKAIVDGNHAFDLAETLAAEINRIRSPERGGLHFFIAAPNAFTFFLGQRRASLGSSTLYEYDFEGVSGGGYRRSLQLSA